MVLIDCKLTADCQFTKPMCLLCSSCLRCCRAPLTCFVGLCLALCSCLSQHVIFSTAPLRLQHVWCTNVPFIRPMLGSHCYEPTHAQKARHTNPGIPTCRAQETHTPNPKPFDDPLARFDVPGICATVSRECPKIAQIIATSQTRI